MSADLYNMI